MDALIALSRTEANPEVIDALTRALGEQVEGRDALTNLIRRCTTEALLPGGVGPLVSRLGASGAPWATPTLVELMREQPTLRVHALRALTGHPLTPEIADICMDVLLDESAARGAQAERTACRELLGTYMGQRYESSREALGDLQAWRQR
ncbi:MAG: hypothetical protein H6741_14595 [Alphaproteobacteria bacterium]|nr:hypothetical protein [Alphaproteobacteria bacterium]